MPAPQIILTRSENEQMETTEILANLGFDVVPCPLSSPFFPLDALSYRSYQAVLVTSRNAVRALARLQVEPDVLLIAVGERTQNLAHRVGFQKVVEGGGTVESMRRIILQQCDPQRGSLLYVRGATIRYDLKRLLTADGFYVDDPIAYGLEFCKRLPPLVLWAIQKQKVWGVLFLSESAARHFCELISKEKLQKSLGTVYFFSLSSSINVSLRGLGRASFVPEKPTFASLCQLLRTVQRV